MGIKLNISDAKSGKTYKKELTTEQSEALFGKKIGDVIVGSSVGFDGYEFTITGGSDDCGFPMRKDIEGGLKRKILSAKGKGIKLKRKGLRVRKTVAGNTVYEKTSQINAIVTKEGKAPLAEEKSEDTQSKQEE